MPLYQPVALLLNIPLICQYHAVDELLKTEYMLLRAINSDPVTSSSQNPVLQGTEPTIELTGISGGN